ncbi:MAG: hypothetical protein M3N32_10645 [Actinomycetota bacterium]|nr:hypothetical protein [Actinomycetota bacterium]
MYTPPADKAEEPEHIAQYLAGPVAATWRALDRGRGAADEFFAEERREFDPHMWAHIVRYEARLSLAKETGPRDWDLRLFHHSGIRLLKDPFEVHVCKAANDAPQNPGRNPARQRFFQQLGLTLFYGEVGANLILYWLVRKGALELGLCRPHGLWDFKGTPKLEWRTTIKLDPLAGLTFAAAEEDDIDVPLRLEEPDLGEDEG